MSSVAEAPPGLTLPSRPGGRSGFLADVIVELGLADREAVDRAAADSRMSGVTLGAELIESGILSERDLARAVAERHGLPLVDLDAFAVDPDAAALVGRATARRYGVAPAGFAADGSLLLAMADPCDSLARSDVAVMTRLDVLPVIAPREQIDAVLDGLPETGLRPPPDPDEPALDLVPASGAMLWQAEETGEAEVRRRPSGMFAVQTADLSAEHEARAQRLGSELAEQKGRAAELELELGAVRTELEELKGRHARKRAELEDRVRGLREDLAELESELAGLQGDLAYRDGCLRELERQLADRDSVLKELGAELARARRPSA